MGDTSWNYSFSFHREWSKVLEDGKNVRRSSELHCVPSLLLNPDKTFNAFGYEAQEHYSELCEDNNEKQYYYFDNITSIFESNQASYYFIWFCKNVFLSPNSTFIFPLISCDIVCWYTMNIKALYQAIRGVIKKFVD